MIRLFLSLFVFASMVPAVALAQGTRVMTVGERIDRYLQTSMQSAPTSGLSAVVVQGDEVLLSTGRAGQYIGLGSSGTIALKKASPDRIKELLGILNYVCAPIGTTEALLMQYGVEGTDFARDANGNLVLTQQGQSDTVVPWKNIGGPPEFLFSSISAEFVPYT
jgi:hypothetical protein